MKRLIAVMLVLAMLVASLALAACKGDEGDQGQNDDKTPFTPAATYSDPEVYKTFHGGVITTTAAGGGSGSSINTVPYAGVEGKDYRDNGFYTYNDFMGGTTGLNWNPHTWETNDDSYVLGYLTMGFYDFALNEDRTGYAIVPEMAADFPVDVTSEYVGQYGIVEGESAKAWKIALNQNATWDDGTAIKAADYIYSMQQQLNTKMLNRRADSYYAGDFEIVNAKNYLYSGKVMYSLINDTVANLTAAGTTIYLDMNFWGVAGAADAEGNKAPTYIAITDNTMYRDTAVADETAAEAWVSAKYLFDTYLADGQVYAGYQGEYLYTASTAPETAWEDVGLIALDDYTLVIFVASAIEEPEFYLPYNLSSTWLVKEDLYEASKKFFKEDGTEVAADGDDVTTITSTYMTTVASSVSYGPYKLTYFEADKQLTFERNDAWYGYSDEKHFGQFQTDKISCQVIGEHKTALQAFLAGDIDSVGLDSADMELYASSDRLNYTPESYTTKLTFNTNYEKLLALGNNAQILAVKEFRQAFAVAIDRQGFASEFTASHEAGFGLLNYMYCYNPFSGELYREDDAAKAALCNVYGLTWGEDGDYETLEEAYEAITGYNMDKAKTLMQAAYDKAVAAKVYDGTSEIKIDFRVYSADEAYVKMFNYFDGQIKKACEGTGFEGKVSLTMTADPDYYETMYAGNTAVIFSTWGGAAMSPFSMISQCYTDAHDGSGNQMELGYNANNVKLTLTVDGEDVTASLKDWADWMNGVTIEAINSKVGKFTDYDYATRCAFFAEVEEVYLSSFVTTPIYYRNVASLTSRKVENGCDTYLQIIGRGGLRHLTYNYTDEAWEDAKGNITY